MKVAAGILLLTLGSLNLRACIWDADTLFQEKLRSHDLASAILAQPAPPEDPQKLQARIQSLASKRDENNPEWWNNLAGAYLRLGKPDVAVKLLEPIATKFTNDYGIHANLGTAYHLLGRYAEAEKEIARDLEINPDAHFGLEKYHLALLQYLVRDNQYKSRHVYVDEFTFTFLQNSRGYFHYTDADEKLSRQMAQDDFTNGLVEAENYYASFSKTNRDLNWKCTMLAELAAFDVPPAYRGHWDLVADTNFEAGVIYMAQMNLKEPASFEMLGLAACQSRDYNLAVSAFEKAIALGSPKSEILKEKIDGLSNYIRASHDQKKLPRLFFLGFLFLILLVILYYIYTKIRDQKRKLNVIT